MRHKKTFIATISVFLFFIAACSAYAATYRTENFVVNADDPAAAEIIAKAAETYRKNLALSFLGECFPNWENPAKITAHIGPNLGAGGSTTFIFNNGEVYGWKMNIQGSYERILDSVLPHEIMHMIMATYFRAPLPRGIEEGTASLVEASSETKKHAAMLILFLRHGRGVPFNKLFTDSTYPADVMPYYAQGFSVVDYLTQDTCGGEKKFMTGFLATYYNLMKTKDRYGNPAYEQKAAWAEALRRTYKDKDGKPLFNDLGDLQTKWLAWVAKGSPRLTSPDAEETKKAGKMLPVPQQCLPPAKMSNSLCPSNPLPVVPTKDAADKPAITGTSANAPKDKNCELPKAVEETIKEREKPTLWLVKIGGPGCMYCVILEKNINQVFSMINSGQLKLNINVKLKKLEIDNPADKLYADRFAGVSGGYPIPILVYLDGNGNYVGGRENATKSGNRSVDQLIQEIKQAEAALMK